MPPAPLTDSQTAASQQQAVAYLRAPLAASFSSSSAALPPQARAAPASPSAPLMPVNSEPAGTESPPRRRQLHELMAASASPPPQQQQPQLSSSTPLPPEQEAQRRVTASSIFSTSTTSFLQSRPAPPSLSLPLSASAASSPVPSPQLLPDSSPSASSLPRQLKTPPRCTPAMIKRGLAASFATILSSPMHYNPAASGSPAAASAAASSSSAASSASVPVMAVFPAAVAQAPFGSLLIPPALAFSSSASPSVRATASPAASRFHPSYAAYAASTAEASPVSRSSSLSPSSAESSLSSSSDSLTPLSSSRSCSASQRCAALALPPLRACMMAATEALADSDSIASCLSSLLRLLLQHARADDARLCSLQDNRHWNVDAHCTAEPPTPPAATARAGPIPVHDPDCLLYDAAAEPEMPVSVLRCAASTASMLQLSPSAVYDSDFRSDPYFLPMAARLPSVLALPVLCCGKVEAVLLLTSARRQDGFVGDLDVPLLQLVCELCVGLVKRRQELRREAELSAMARSLREMKEENSRLQQQLQTAQTALAASRTQ